MNKKGITLIELLAVIVILSIVALIIVPTVNKVIDSAKETSFRASVNGIVDSATTYLQKYLAHHEELPAVFLCNGEKCGNGDDLLTIKGKVPISGKVVLSEDGALAEYITDGKLCAYGYKWNLIIGACRLIDQSAPVIDEDKASLIVVTSTTNSIRVSMPEGLMTDEETLIEYTVTLYLDDGKVATKKYNGEDIVFTNLINNKEYKVVITGTNESKLKTIIEKTISTSDIVKPTIAYTNDPTSDVNGYFRSQTLNVSYTKGNIENPEYYIRSGRNASTNINVIAICGTTTNPSECSEMTGTTIEADTWYKVSGSISVIYNIDSNTESSLTALIYDGTNYVGSGSKAVGKIDNTAPTVTTIIYNSGNGTDIWQNNINITLSATDNVGISHYEIDYNGDGVADTTTAANFVPHSGWSSCDNRFRAVDLLGNKGGWSNSVHVHQDSTNPTHTDWWWGEVNLNVARLYIRLTDNVGVPSGGTYNSSLYNGHNVGVYCPTSTATGGYANWVWFPGVWDAGANAYRCDITPATFGHYGQAYITHLYIWDYAGNGGYYNQTSVSIPALCSFTSQDFGYTGGVQAFTVPSGCGGTYKLEVWGAQGGSIHATGTWSGYSRNITANGGYGGYAVGYASLSGGQTIYIVVGGQPSLKTSHSGGETISGGGPGYNGGGDVGTYKSEGNGGGGATHIGKTNSLLKNTAVSNLYIVAGGGGGAAVNFSGWPDGRSTANDGGSGGTQSGGGSGGDAGSYGQGGTSWSGGGGGYYGGGGGGNYNGSNGGGGGSGYVGGVSSGSMSNGQRAGHGYARITKQ